MKGIFLLDIEVELAWGLTQRLLLSSGSAKHPSGKKGVKRKVLVQIQYLPTAKHFFDGVKSKAGTFLLEIGVRVQLKQNYAQEQK